MEITPDKYLNRMNELLRKKKELLSAITCLTKDQTDVISEEGLDRLGEMIGEKQKKIDEINKIDEEFGIYLQRFKSVTGISKLEQLDVSKLGATETASAKELKSLTSDIMAAISEISEIEKANTQKSKNLLDEFGNQIKNINKGKKANNAYKPTPISSPSYFLDKKK